MFDFVTENALVVGVVSSLLAAFILGAYHRIKVRKLGRKQREVVTVDQSGRPLVGCRIGSPKLGMSEDRSDRQGHLGIPPKWPRRMNVYVTKNGHRLLNNVNLDFSETNSVTLIVPPVL